MDLYILNKADKVVCVVSSEGENNFLASAKMKEAVNQMNTLEFDIFSLGAYVQEVREENSVLFQDDYGTWRNFIIKEITEIHDSTENKSVYAEDSSQELIDDVILNEYKDQELNPTQLLGIALSGTRWEVGEVDSLASIPFPQETKNKTVLDFIYMIAEAYTLQVDFKVNVMGNKIVSRTVDMKHRIGSDVGKRFEFSKDIEKIERRINSGNLKTAVIPFGDVPEDEESNAGVPEEERPKKPPIDITGIEWTIPNNPVNKPLGQNYLEFPEATAQWGYLKDDGTMKARFVVYENTECKTPEELINKAYQYLKGICKPEVNYTLNVIDLYALTQDEEYSFEGVRLGDTVSVIDHFFSPAILLKTSVISREVDLLEPQNTTIELGSFIRNLVDSESSQHIQNMIDTSLSTGLEGLESKVTDVSKSFELFKKEYSSNEINYNWIKNSDFSNSLKYYNSWNGSDLVVQAVSELPFFSSAGFLTKGNFTQEIEGGLQLLNHNVTLSAFVYGQGILSIEVHYTDATGVGKFDTINSNVIPAHDGWARYSLTGAIKQEPHMKSMVSIVVSFIPQGQAYFTGLQLNLGTSPSKYVKNPYDKYGRGVYDQVRAVSNAEFKNGLGYVYLEEEDGLWIYDKPSNGHPQKVTALKGGMLGIGSWNPQSQQWDIKTFIDGNMVNASCINTGRLNADLVKTGNLSSLDGTVQINMENGRFVLGSNASGDAVQIANGQLVIKQNNGDYSTFDATGIKHHTGSTSKDYHYLATTIGFIASGDPNHDVTVTLPREFRGKNFTAQAVLSDTYSDSWNYGEPWVVQRMVVHVSSMDIANGTVTVKGYRTDKNYSTGEHRWKPVSGILIVIA
ncbi:phage tail spike protein [Clostridium perfringens]|nr:phage tail spike protein [Clostridium perfringens]